MVWIRRLLDLGLALVYSVFVMPILSFLIIFMPIMAVSDGFKIIRTGYSVKQGNMSMLVVIAMLVYISLRIRGIRRIYAFFPFLYETIKYIMILYIFAGVGMEVTNWLYMKVSTTRHVVGTIVFIGSLILWRVFISIYYTKKPLVSFGAKHEEKITHYS